jgi:hypothetical protein
MVMGELARTLLATHGKLRSQPAEDRTGDFPLPLAVADFYREVGPVNVTIEVGGNPVFLPRLSRLWKHQEGYRFVGRKRQREESWADDWLVAGDQGADPLILSRASGTVLFARHGAGDWDPKPMFPDQNAMAACLAVVANSAMGGERAPVLDELSVLLGQPDAATRVLSALGYSAA